MPNWCENQLFVRGKKVDVAAFMEFARSGRDDDGAGSVLDFNKIAPYPDEFSLADAARRKWNDENEGVEWDKRPPQPKDGYNAGGYEWCVKNWGTKWPASDPDVYVTSRGCTYTFNTAWGPPGPVVIKASELFPELTFKLKYWEGGQGFKGELTAKAGQHEEWDGDYSGDRGG